MTGLIIPNDNEIYSDNKRHNGDMGLFYVVIK